MLAHYSGQIFGHFAGILSCMVHVAFTRVPCIRYLSYSTLPLVCLQD